MEARQKQWWNLLRARGEHIMAINCCSYTCGRLQPSKQRKVVWTIDRRPYCNCCFLNWMDANEIRHESIVRLYDDDKLYDDTRLQKRKSRKPPIMEQSLATMNA